MTYAEYLRSQGATDDEIKILDVPLARKAFEKMQTDLSAAESARKAAETAAAEIETKTKEWYDSTVVPTYESIRNESIRNAAELAKAKTALIEIQKRGLVNVAKDMGYDPEGAPPADKTPAAAFDPEKFFQERIVPLAASEGDAIAVAQDIAAEHRVLFPDRPLNFRELRREAVAAKKPVEQFWMERYGVQAARDAKAAADKEAYERKLRDEGAAAERARYADQANPNMRPFAPSASPFTPRPAANREKQPWEIGSEALAGDRVARATKKVLETVVH